MQPEQKPEQTLTEDQQVLKEFNSSLNSLIQKVSNYKGSKKQLQRLLINLSVHPLNSEELEWKYPEEKELFELATTVASTKFFLMLSGMESEGRIKFVEQSNQGESHGS